MMPLFYIIHQSFIQSFLRTLGVTSDVADTTKIQKATFDALDEQLYPIELSGQCFANAKTLLLAILKNDLSISANEFAKHLAKQSVYQSWINFTVYGCYVERSFQAFYQQEKDDFNMEMSGLLLQELKRHTRCLPKNQVLFASGFSQKQLSQKQLSQRQLDRLAGEHRLLNVTVNPAFAVAQADGDTSTTVKVINMFCVASTGVLAVAIKPRQLTNQRHRNELLIVGFKQLRLQQEQRLTTTNGEYVVKFYQIS